MKKGVKIFCKVLSVFLAMLFILEVLPTQVMADAYTAAVAEKEYIEDILNNPTNPENNTDANILYEVEEKRDEYTKVYKKSDGTYTAVMTEEPLHYLDEGVWEEIDNSMILDGSLYTNLSNLFNVELPKNIDEDKELTVEKDGYELSFSIGDIENSSAVVENDIVESDTEIADADSAISQTQSSVTYNDIADNTDLQYIVTPNSIKENIIVSNKESVKDIYTFTFETNGLNAEKQNDGSVLFKDNNGDIKFTIPRPVMTDANFAFSYDIGVSLTQNANGTVTLEYAPSINWTSSSERVYPIIIDPAIKVENYANNLAEDTFVFNYSEDENSIYENHYEEIIGVVGNQTETSGETRLGEIYTKINIEKIKSLGSNLVITEAQYLFNSLSAGGYALAKKIAEPVNLTTVTYATKPELENEVIDYHISPFTEISLNSSCYVHFNITKPLNDWLNGEDNNGFAVVAGNEGYYGLFATNGASTSQTNTTIMIIDFIDVAGNSEYFNYHSQSAGRAGTGYVNDFTQTLSVIRDDLSIDGNIMPVTVGMTYNPSQEFLAKYSGATLADFYCGLDWMPNYHRMVAMISNKQILYYTDTGSLITFDLSTDEDGKPVLTETNADIYGESGYTAEFIAKDNGTYSTSFEYLQINRPDGYVERFKSTGYLESISNPDYPNQKISVYYEYPNYFGRIDYITDGVGRKYDYVYNNSENLLTKVKCYSANGIEILAGTTTSSLEVNYTYDENRNLTGVTYPDGKTITYIYDSNGNMTSMTNIDGYRVVYSYGKKDEDGNEIPEYINRITKITEQAYDGTDYVDGNYLTYERLSATQIKLTDGNGNYEIYQFDSKGNLLYTTDSNGNYVMNEGSNSNDDTYFVSSGDYRANAENLLFDSSFEDDGDCWSNTNSAFDVVESENAYCGSNICVATRTSNATVYQKQTVEVLSGGEYTFSAYVKSDETNTEKLYLNISSYNSSNTKTKTESIPVESTGGEWQRYSVTINAPSNTKKLAVEFGFKNSKGTFYIDNVQLEQANSASGYNYIENGGFRNNLESWTASNNYSIVDTEINDVTEKAIMLTGGTISNNTLYQTVKIDGKKDDVFTVGGWLKATFVNSSTNNEWIIEELADSKYSNLFNFTNDRYAQIELSYRYTETNENDEEETFTETIVVPFSENLDDWQFAAQSFALKGDCEEVTVLIRYAKNTNSALVSNVELTKDEDAVVFSDDEEETTEDTATCPCEDCEEIDCTCTCESEALCGCVPCQRRSSITERDSFGNITSSNSFNGVKTIQTLAQYSEDGNYLVSETDEDGNTVTYDYNLLNGLLKAITDANGNKTSYTYDANGSLTHVSLEDSSANYTYVNDKLTAITHNGFSYNLSYDLWGQLTQVSVGTQPIISYTYGENEYRDRIVTSKYHNDDSEIYDNSVTTTTEYQYDDAGNITEIIVNGETKFIYTYDSLGGLTEISATDSRIIRYTDDRTDILDFDDNYIYSSYTNDDGDFVETIGGVTYTSKTYDSSYDITTGITTEKSDVIATNGKTIGTVDKQDWFGRYTESVVKTESANDTNTENTFAAVKTEYTYSEYSDNKTSNRVDEYVNKVYYGTDSEGTDYKSYSRYSYEYDGNGNITAEYGKNNVLRYRYYYDSLNQLVRVNDNIKNATYVYEYDTAGNILSKKEYSYTEADTITAEPENVIEYDYNEVWKDRLDSYGNTAITYDNIGNPLTIGDKSFTWSGRQLETYTQGNKTIEFEYDENGLRHRKTVKENGVITERYDYVWSEGTLVSQTYSTYSNGEVDTTNSAKFIYDSWGTLQGFVLNDTSTYLYTKSLQGDILSIVNENGQTILTYSYDAWGAVSFSISSVQNMMLAYTLSFVSPFTYRGYCYDYDIELYYLQSRYYSAEIGRFINTDDTQIAIATQGEILGANLFAYCNNNPVNYVDPTGYVLSEAAAATGIVAICCAMLVIATAYIIVNLFNTYASSNIKSSVNVNTKLDPFLKWKTLIALGKALILQIYATMMVVKTIVEADTEIKTKVTRKSTTRYWTATLQSDNKYVDIGRAINFNQAVTEVRAGRNVFTVTKAEAEAVARAASNGKNPTWHKKHKNRIGYYEHYHLYGHTKDGHVWYLFS